MNKQRFLYLLNNYRSLTSDETVELTSLQKLFPYSQVIRNMVTWGAYHNDLPTKRGQLYLANIYSPNIEALQFIITAPRVKRDKAPNDNYFEDKKVDRSTPTHSQTSVATDKHKEEIIDLLSPDNAHQIDKLISELPQDLFYLKEVRHKFEVTAQELEDTLKKKSKNPTRALALKRAKKEAIPKRANRKKIVKKSVKKKKKVAKKVALKKIEIRKTKKIATKKITKKKLTKKIKNKKILGREKKNLQKKTLKKQQESIFKKNSPKKILQQEQFEIIDQFINNKPRIGIRKNAEEESKLADLSVADNGPHKKSVSDETLVKILIARGKKRQAIEVLKKLIWKTPQRKHYFMAQIKKLEV